MARNVLLVERAGWAPSRTDASHDQATGIVDAARRAVCRDPVPDHAGRCPDRGRSPPCSGRALQPDRKSTRLNSSHTVISYAVFCLKKKTKNQNTSRVN